MKKTIALVAICCLTLTIKAQNIKNLELTIKTKIVKENAIYLEPIDNDRLLLNDYFKNSLKANGFKITDERKDATYAITTKVSHRSDTGCGGRSMSQMDGEIIDIKNSAEKVASFTFHQGAFSGKCTSDIMSALAKKMNEQAK